MNVDDADPGYRMTELELWERSVKFFDPERQGAVQGSDEPRPSAKVAAGKPRKIERLAVKDWSSASDKQLRKSCGVGFDCWQDKNAIEDAHHRFEYAAPVVVETDYPPDTGLLLANQA